MSSIFTFTSLPQILQPYLTMSLELRFGMLGEMWKTSVKYSKMCNFKYKNCLCLCLFNGTSLHAFKYDLHEY
ncbi:hypothetical protein CDL12_14556 [Handroanthus impetiginosus]|uniref:Uncharacterized protein n=1 Tax=Handroanthus impetiginosus TaxID=429701 RepID=A0A2G9H5N8_9LAMI|nr:hypothetical protein CDL12_14556 [Handroanthus impetiginosus]